jgi:hypothetical protein
MSPNNPVANRRVLEPEHSPKRIMLGSLVLSQMAGTQSAVSWIAAPFTVTLLDIALGRLEERHPQH